MYGNVCPKGCNCWSLLCKTFKDLERNFDRRAHRNFKIEGINVRLFGVGGRTVQKVCHFDLKTIFSQIL